MSPRFKDAGPAVDATGGPGEFAGYAAVFDNVDSDGDVIRRGAFASTLAEWKALGRPIPVLWGHNMADPEYNIGHVVDAVEDEHGLKVSAQIDLETPKGAAAYRLLKGGRVANMSFAFDVLDGGPARGKGAGVTELRDLKLYEVSVVPIGANQLTSIVDVKGQSSPRLRIRERELALLQM